MSFALLVLGLVATVGLQRDRLPLAAAVIVAGAVFGGALLDALSISPETFRIAAGIVLTVGGARSLVRPARGWVTGELACLSVVAGADHSTAAALLAGAIALLLARPLAHERAGRLLAAAQIVVGVALAVSGVRSV